MIPASVKRTRIRKPKEENKEAVGEMPAEEQRELLPKEEMQVAKNELNQRGPFANRHQAFDLLTRASGNRLVFQGRVNGKIIDTDLEGYPIPRRPDSKQLIFNSTPDDIRRMGKRAKFNIGEVVYAIRPMSRNRKVYAGRVEAFDVRGVVLTVLGAIGDAKFSKNRTREDGTIIYPYAFCFKDTQALQQYLDGMRDDFARSQTDFRHLLEQSRK